MRSYRVLRPTPNAAAVQRSTSGRRSRSCSKVSFARMHSDLGIVWETEGDRLFGHERTAARERCAQAMHCVAETFQQRSRVFRTAG